MRSLPLEHFMFQLHNITARLKAALETPNSLFPTSPSMSLCFPTRSARRDEAGDAGLYIIGQLRVEWSSEGLNSSAQFKERPALRSDQLTQ